MDNVQEITLNTTEEYLTLLDEFEIELSSEEKKDLDELNELLRNHKEQNDLSTEIWATIKKATIDSVEQIIGLSDRGDWRPEQGAIITTPLNFQNGVVATSVDKQRFEMWQDRLNGRAPSASEFRQDRARFGASFEKAKEVFKSNNRNPDGSYNNDYNDTVVYDQSDPRAYKEADASGDMIRDTRKTLNVDHINSVKEAYEDALIALYGGSTEKEFDETMRNVENNPDNFAISDEHANKSMQDRDTLETAENNPELGMDPQKVKEAQTRADKAKNKELFKESFGEKSKDLVVGIGKSTLAATGKMLVGVAMKIAISETVVEFNKNVDEPLMDRVKRIVHNIIERAKAELQHIWSKIAEFAANNAISEIVNLIINYFVSTVKNVFKLIRCLFGSIIQAFKIIFDESKPWEERLFEALKIISAGIAMATGTMLNELIAKAIATNIPFLAGFAGDISAVISGLISSILSALVLMSFDRYKATLKINDENCQMQLLSIRLTGYDVSHALVSSARASVVVDQTTELVRRELEAITEYNSAIETYRQHIQDSLAQQHQLNDEIDILQKECETAMDALHDVRKSCNKRINEKLNKLPDIEDE